MALSVSRSASSRWPSRKSASAFCAGVLLLEQPTVINSAARNEAVSRMSERFEHVVMTELLRCFSMAALSAALLIGTEAPLDDFCFCQCSVGSFAANRGHLHATTTAE